MQLVSWLWAALVLAALSIGLAFVPLFNLLGFEFAVAMGAMATAVASTLVAKRTSIVVTAPAPPRTRASSSYEGHRRRA